MFEESKLVCYAGEPLYSCSIVFGSCFMVVKLVINRNLIHLAYTRCTSLNFSLQNTTQCCGTLPSKHYTMLWNSPFKTLHNAVKFSLQNTTQCCETLHNAVEFSRQNTTQCCETLPPKHHTML